MSISRQSITGLVLAGGRGSRMGGVDKGLQMMAGQALARRAAQRLSNQVGGVIVNANRHLDVYAQWPWPVVTDQAADRGLIFDGPLAGIAAALRQCRTPWLAVVPCDAPRFPIDLVVRLAAAVQQASAELAFVETGQEPDSAQAQPTFSLLNASLLGDLEVAMRQGERGLIHWFSSRRHVRVRFDDAAAFVNLNTLEQLSTLDAAVPADDSTGG